MVCVSAREPAFRPGVEVREKQWPDLSLSKAIGTVFGCCAQDVEPRAEVLQQQPSRAAKVVAAEQEAARLLISCFCEDVPAMRVAPTQDELDSLWEKCKVLQAKAVSGALSDQLAIGADEGEHSWQFQVRALHFLTHLYSKSIPGKEIASGVMANCGELVRYLAQESPECGDEASRALLVWQLATVVPSGQEIHIADEGGLLYFTAGTIQQTAHLQESAPSPSPKPPPVQQLDLLTSASCDANPLATDLADLISLDDAPPEAAADVELISFLPSTTAPTAPAALVVPSAFVPPTPRAAAAAPERPQRFDIGGGDSVRDSPELNSMFSFKRRLVLDIPLVTDKYVSEQLPKPSDPFDFVAEHVRRFQK